ncbi:hypothetical protein [Streptomyces reniochalinae]|uniref:Secreted protein n=1 Tax=Streptomyces reniochalinae TaxID=2250578 RepID=A0A367EVS3_9ACTN|nr:hypothetical protein [Streptomyces reniochalinae]RCG22246.1 hypothetical protein DQ392_07080 [Streptomyces reniochalinae]
MFTILLIAGLGVVLAVAVGLAFRFRQEVADRDGEDLQGRFGPEYDRTLARRRGDVRTTRRELRVRLKRYAQLQVLPLDRAAREHYLARWTALEEDFSADPGRALDAAEVLLTELAAERGYPAQAPFEDLAAALSVHHARRVHGYRRVHEAARAAHADHRVTEDARAALLSAGALFDSLLTARSSVSAPPARRAAGAVRPRVS